MRVLVVGPDRQDIGGVANYYNAVFPRLENGDEDTLYLEVGSTHGKHRGAHVVLDQVRFGKIITKYRPDVIHLNPSLDMRSFLRDGVFILQAKLRRVPVLVFFRGWEKSFELTVSRRLKWFFNVSYRRADRYIVLASQFRDQLREWGVDAPISLGTTAVADEMLETFSIDGKASEIEATKSVRILYLARLEKEKGVMELLEAVRRLLNDGADIFLTVAGDGPMMGAVRAAVSEFGEYGDRVEIAGYVRGDRKIDMLNSHHIYCFPTSYGEGMPNSLLEAMAFGMPIITCPVGGIRDFFIDGEMGVLLREVNPDDVVNALASLVSDQARLALMARKNHSYAMNNFLASTAAEMLRSTYRDITAGKRSATSVEE